MFLKNSCFFLPFFRCEECNHSENFPLFQASSFFKKFTGNALKSSFGNSFKSLSTITILEVSSGILEKIIKDSFQTMFRNYVLRILQIILPKVFLKFSRDTFLKSPFCVLEFFQKLLVKFFEKCHWESFDFHWKIFKAVLRKSF